MRITKDHQKDGYCEGYVCPLINDGWGNEQFNSNVVKVLVLFLTDEPEVLCMSNSGGRFAWSDRTPVFTTPQEALRHRMVEQLTYAEKHRQLAQAYEAEINKLELKDSFLMEKISQGQHAALHGKPVKRLELGSPLDVNIVKTFADINPFGDEQKLDVPQEVDPVMDFFKKRNHE